MVFLNNRVVRGSKAEQIAADFLSNLGFLILHRNYRIRGGEIDIIALEGDTLCFIEVRSRKQTQHGHPIETISLKKQMYLTKVAEHFLIYVWQKPACPCRFDVIAIEGPEPRIALLRNAF